jgi:aldose 1-epimerase
MSVERRAHGALATGEGASLFTLRNGDAEASFSEFGATWVSMILPSASSGRTDVVLGFPSLDGYLGKHPYFGATVGRFANRIGGASFALGGKDYSLEANDGKNSLHSGSSGWGLRLWKGEASGDSVEFSLEDADGSGGFPGRVEARVRYALGAGGELRIDFFAKSDADTHVNMTNHAYFNLGGGADILAHELTMSCSKYLEPGPGNIPTGKILSVEGSPLDFRARKPLGRDIAAMGSGYDHCFVIDRKGPGLVRAASVIDPLTRRTLDVASTQPGIQLYTGNYLNGEKGKGTKPYGVYGGFCLETQHFPDTPNKTSFPSTLLEAGKEYAEKAVYAFGW